MLEPPADLAPEELVAALATDYGLRATDVRFLPLGHDASAWVFRAASVAGDLFIKVRTALTNKASLIVPHYLAGAGVAEIVAPRPTLSGGLWTTAGRYAVIVYPYVADRTGMSHGMSNAQWHRYGAILRHIHATAISAELRDVMRVESFQADGADAVRALDAHISTAQFASSGELHVAALWRAQRATIWQLLERAEDLGRRVAAAKLPLVLCHADIHTNNVLVDDEQVWITDWDETMLAPRERDLMFAIGGIGPGFVSPDQERLFLDGYGPVDVNQVALAFYRYAWAIADIGAYGEQVFFRPDLGPRSTSDAVDKFASQFRAGSIVDIALNSPT